jgi:hypothetical protein
LQHSKFAGQCLSWVKRDRSGRPYPSNDVRFSPKAVTPMRNIAKVQNQTNAVQQTSRLFDDLVSERNQLCRRLKVRRLGATENALDVRCRLAELFGSRSYFDALAILRSRWPVS